MIHDNNLPVQKNVQIKILTLITFPKRIFDQQYGKCKKIQMQGLNKQKFYWYLTVCLCHVI